MVGRGGRSLDRVCKVLVQGIGACDRTDTIDRWIDHARSGG